MEYQQTQPHEKIIPFGMPDKLWEVVCADISTFNNNALLCIEDLFCCDLSADNLIRIVKIVFAEFGLPKKILTDAGTNFILEHFTQFCRQLNIQQAITSSYHYQKNGEV